MAYKRSERNLFPSPLRKGMIKQVPRLGHLFNAVLNGDSGSEAGMTMECAARHLDGPVRVLRAGV